MAEQSERDEEGTGEISVRYDTPVYFLKITPGEYDPNTGNYGDDTVEETLV